MAVSHPKTQTFDSQSHPSGCKLIKGVNGDEQQHPQFQDTEPFEDAFVLDSPLMEETQLVDHSDLAEKTSTGMHAYEEEVVLDSEDEDVNGSRIVSVKLNGLSNEKLSHHRQQCGTGGKDEGSPRLARLNCIGSREPEESSSQANALEFVDHFVSLNDDPGFYPEVYQRKTSRVKSPPVSNIKGSQSLARMIKLGSQFEKTKTFEWVDHPGEHGGVYLFSKKMESSFDFGDCNQRSVVVRHQKVRNVGDRKCSSSGNECQEKEITESEVNIGNDSVNVAEELDAKSIGPQLDASAMGTDLVDMFDIGFDTQIAAEAMEALAYGDQPGCKSADAYQGIENTEDVVSRGATDNKAHLEVSSLQKSDIPNVGVINRTVKRRKRSTRISRRVVASPQKQSENQELDPDLAALAKVKRSRFWADYCNNSAEANGSFYRQSPKPFKQRKLEGATGGSNLNSVVHQTRQSMSGGRLKRTEDGSNNNPGERMNTVMEDGIITYRRKKRSSNAHPSEIFSGTDGGSNKPVERMNKVIKDDTITYRRKKKIGAKENCSNFYVSSEGDGNTKPSGLKLDLWSHPKGKRTRLNARSHSCRATVFYTPFPIVDGNDCISHNDERPEKPVERMNKVMKDDTITYRRKKKIGAKENCSNFYVSSEGDGNTKPSGLKLDLWRHPKGKRTRLNARSHSCRATVFYTPFPIVDGNDCISHNDERPETSNNMKGKAQSLQFGKLDGTDPISLVHGSECTAPSNSTSGIHVVSSKYVSHDHHRKPYNKNLPKSSLLKELIGHSVPESISDFTWKDLRRRRHMAYVRVLFSQHLDDDVIRQQKKIISRLGLSIASCSSDATHFIADQFARTRNMLECIALGKPVVTHLWLESCGQANCLISEKSYILRDAKKEKEIGFSMLVSLDCAKRCPLLKGLKVFITPNIKPDKEMMTSLVKTVQGRSVEKVQISAAKGKKILEDLLILSCEEDHAICLPFLEKGVAVYSSELLLNGLVIQRLEYKRHLLFTNVVKRTRPWALGPPHNEGNSVKSCN